MEPARGLSPEVVPQQEGRSAAVSMLVEYLAAAPLRVVHSQFLLSQVAHSEEASPQAEQWQEASPQVD